MSDNLLMSFCIFFKVGFPTPTPWTAQQEVSGERGKLHLPLPIACITA